VSVSRILKLIAPGGVNQMLIGFLNGILAALVLSQAPQPSNADWRWLEESRSNALETFMPMRPDLSTLVTYRCFGTSTKKRKNATSLYGTLPATDPNRLEATVVIPTGVSIQQQILDLHMHNRKATLETVLSQVKVRRIQVDAASCPAVRLRIDALSKTAIALPDRGVLYLHPFLYHLFINLDAGEIDVTVHDEDNPVVRWANETLDALLACG
jgi:hypothetical protein